MPDKPGSYSKRNTEMNLPEKDLFGPMAIPSLSCQVRRMTRTNHSTDVHLYYRRHFWLENRRDVLKGYEPNELLLGILAMEAGRSQSMPVGDRNMEVVNPFHSEKVQAECLLEASRPRSLPVLDGGMGPQGVAVSGKRDQSDASATAKLGKGRGGFSANEVPDAAGPTVNEKQNALRTEGRMQGCDDPVLSQGQVKSAGSSGMDESSDGLQRALEGELVEFLRSQNSKLMQRVGMSQRATAACASESRFWGCFVTMVCCEWNFSRGFKWQWNLSC